MFNVQEHREAVVESLEIDVALQYTLKKVLSNTCGDHKRAAKKKLLNSFGYFLHMYRCQPSNKQDKDNRTSDTHCEQQALLCSLPGLQKAGYVLVEMSSLGTHCKTGTAINSQ